MESEDKYYIVHNPVERTAPFEKKVTLVSVLNGELSATPEILFNRKNFKLINEGLNIVDTPLAPYCVIEEVSQEKFDSTYKFLA